MLEIQDLLARRRSLRAIDPHRPLPPEVRDRILEAARWAPSTGNMQPWHFVAVEAPEALERARTALKPGNQIWAGKAPMLIVVCADPAADTDLNGQPLYLFDCGLAIENLLLQGIAEGLVTHPMAGWDEEPMREALKIPLPYRLICTIAFGYPGELSDLPEQLQQRETAERTRKPLSEIVHLNEWSIPHE